MGKGELLWLTGYLGITPNKLTAPSSFNERLKVQKAAFLLRHKGIAPFTKYNFSLYLHGPYSPTLATTYYSLTGVKASPLHLDTKLMALLKWFTSNNEKWLEVASSIISIKERYTNAKPDDIYSVLTLSKPWVNRAMFKSVLTQLDKKEIL